MIAVSNLGLGGYTDTHLSPSDRSNYGLREEVLALRKKLGRGPTAIPSHGANPGLVSHWVKQALLNIARDTGLECEEHQTQVVWAQWAQRLNILVIQCAERDTQVAHLPKQVDEFVNTWSIEGFSGEGSQPAELGWSSHEKYFPVDGKNLQLQSARRLLMNDIVVGTDELGVLLMGHARNAYWYGCVLSIQEARELAPHNNQFTGSWRRARRYHLGY